MEAPCLICTVRAQTYLDQTENEKSHHNPGALEPRVIGNPPGPPQLPISPRGSSLPVCSIGEKGQDGVPYYMSSNKDRSHISLASKNLSSTTTQRTD
eukprot:1155843-Pelagomonas_calceolata.AAC.6